MNKKALILQKIHQPILWHIKRYFKMVVLADPALFPNKSGLAQRDTPFFASPIVEKPRQDEKEGFFSPLMYSPLPQEVIYAQNWNENDERSKGGIYCVSGHFDEAANCLRLGVPDDRFKECFAIEIQETGPGRKTGTPFAHFQWIRPTGRVIPPNTGPKGFLYTLPNDHRLSTQPPYSSWEKVKPTYVWEWFDNGVVAFRRPANNEKLEISP